MATKDDRPSLLSKVAMFVRNPTKDWSELDRPQHEEESGYDKQALKAMIERKRANDFVRRREFDQLRKLRSQGASAVAELGARPSLFQTSHVTDQDGRAVTLKKIDEIEAQMSKQWWKGKQDGNTPPNALGAATSQAGSGTSRAAAGQVSNVPAQLVDHFATTAAPPIADPAKDDFAPTEMGSGMAPGGPAGASAAKRGGATLGIESYAVSDVGFTQSRDLGAGDADMATDPELEEAAIRFANGDDAGAEATLLAALRGQGGADGAAQSWVAALLDLCRATENRTRFEQVVQEFSVVLAGVRPQWAPLSQMVVMAAAPEPNLLWDSPAHLTVAAMEGLREKLGDSPMPWHLGWSHLESVASDAAPLLGGLFSSLCNEPVVLQISGGDQLSQVVGAMTPSGNRNTDPTWWALRLDVLRTLRRQDAFEMVALDYCVTYEDVPPPWHDPRCTLLDAVPAASTTAAANGGAQRYVALNGAVIGDATQALSALEGEPCVPGRIAVQCQKLSRVDFAAAGSILNWVSARQTEGYSVQFRDVHRLVAAFFNVIGVSEQAQVLLRPL